jgi:pimeloyl-ACP methyl ester carboxylesterase
VAAPTLLVWGLRDRYLGVGLTEGLGRWVPDLRVARLRGASHWVQNDAAEEVNRLLLHFLRAGE